MKFIHDRNSNILFSLHDSRVKEITYYNETLGEGRFNGKSIGLQQFIDEYTDSEFEIIIEGYYGNTTTYTGWLREDGKRPVSAIMYVWNSGDMVYNVQK